MVIARLRQGVFQWLIPPAQQIEDTHTNGFLDGDIGQVLGSLQCTGYGPFVILWQICQDIPNPLYWCINRTLHRCSEDAALYHGRKFRGHCRCPLAY